ncbi:copper homeostasis protein CutC [Streptomyces acidiscabies]|uniref:Copper homeostasis protein cutC homolog n=1 Tax=Streptomyces acidiscabies TaxID=42234 RepID=A0A0L0KGA8_9ACTN|nr:copper homeostasis protein CutC [Streptomyces acidiscabies]KND36898.1 copper homeostasis protein CutC [Streptomyces acidiscabies]
MSTRPLLEVIALTPEDAVAAQSGGADRVELVSEMAADGLTPALSVFGAVRAAVDIDVRVMLRGSAGFAAGDLDQLVRAAGEFRQAGADQFVLGFLDAEGAVDVGAVERLTAQLDGCRWTFHRALDHAADREAVRKALAGMPGLDTYLTAGSPDGVERGMETLLGEAGRYEQRLLVGGGLTLAHVPALRAAGVDAFHVGGAVRPYGWAEPVAPEAVRTWRRAIDPA